MRHNFEKDKITITHILLIIERSKLQKFQSRNNTFIASKIKKKYPMFFETIKNGNWKKLKIIIFFFDAWEI